MRPITRLRPTTKSRNTDDWYFHPYVASISVRENRRDLTSGANAEWINPNYHTVNDVESSYARDDDGDGKRDDIELGYNAVRTTLGLVAELAGAHIGTSNQAAGGQPAVGDDRRGHGEGHHADRLRPGRQPADLQRGDAARPRQPERDRAGT